MPKFNSVGDPLTSRQQEVFDFIVEEIKKGRPPSLKEIGNACYPNCLGMTAVTSARNCLWYIEKKGYITRKTGETRAIWLTDLGRKT